MSDLPLKKMPSENKLLQLFVKLDKSIGDLQTKIDQTLLKEISRALIYDDQDVLRQFYKTVVIPMSISLRRCSNEIKQEIIEEVQEMLDIFESMEKKKNKMLMLAKEKILNDSKDIQATMEQRIKILENDFKRAEAQYTYAYADVRDENQDLLMTISKLKAKLKLAEKEKNVNTKSKPVTSCSTPKNEQRVASSSSVSISESKDTNSKNRILLNTKSKRTSKDVKKSQTKTVNVVHDGSNLVCVSCGKDVLMISHDKCVARYALSSNSRVKRALSTSPIAVKSIKLADTLLVAKSRFSVATPPKATDKLLPISIEFFKNLPCIKAVEHMIEDYRTSLNFHHSDDLVGGLFLFSSALLATKCILLYSRSSLNNVAFCSVVNYSCSSACSL
ncbi:hypothetical protein Tco_1393696 [Tanacetum coccineum]